mgnify:CR=1 FL=1
MAEKKSPTKSILDFASRFVKDREGEWNHEDWEQALKKVEDAGVAAEEEVKRHFGNVLEAAKYFYQLETSQEASAAATKPRTAKPAAKAKAKSKPKAKAKAKPKPKTTK